MGVREQIAEIGKSLISRCEETPLCSGAKNEDCSNCNIKWFIGEILSLPGIYTEDSVIGERECPECKGASDELFCSQCGDSNCTDRSTRKSHGCCDATCKICKGTGKIPRNHKRD